MTDLGFLELAAGTVGHGGRPLPASAGPQHRKGEFSRSVQTAIDYMNNNFSRPITLRDLAKLTDRTPSQIIRAFRRDVGITPHAWLIRRRVFQGKVLIELGVSIATAASEAGFFDQTHFTRHFKRVHGHTPARYRSTTWNVAKVASKTGTQKGTDLPSAKNAR